MTIKAEEAQNEQEFFTSNLNGGVIAMGTRNDGRLLNSTNPPSVFENKTPRDNETQATI